MLSLDYVTHYIGCPVFAHPLLLITALKTCKGSGKVVGQVNRMWWISFIVWLQLSWGHNGMLEQPILWRWLRMGAWPVQMWVSRLVCLQVSMLVIFVNLAEGREGSISLSLAYLGDSFCHIVVLCLVSLLIIWQTSWEGLV